MIRGAQTFAYNPEQVDTIFVLNRRVKLKPEQKFHHLLLKAELQPNR